VNLDCLDGLIANPYHHFPGGVMKKYRQRKNIFPLLMIGFGAFIIIAAAGWYAVQLFQQPAAEPLATTAAEENYPEITRVDVKDARAAYETGSAVFVDVRTAEAFEQSHIAGALSIPLSELPQQLGQLSKSDWIITY
jgi:hypothetical protein